MACSEKSAWRVSLAVKRAAWPGSSGSLTEEDRSAKVLVLLTGGTMAMKPNAHGSLEPCAGYLAVQMRLMPELRERRMPAYEVVEYAPLLDSGDFVPGDWKRIAADIADAHERYDAQRPQMLLRSPAGTGATPATQRPHPS